ncbi:TetR family transcriptional regulator [Compostimonas suwonensis]|uniref:AcrR family transcriptional regulator n=1 Tax=Compostimonas suwonensis TaxID=1048394 RepID=A0A2M9C510_9MICO|nr:TetR family transcriptional regulator [Compostimonas suwonensis]PJJ65557.1 AcrR family transcriptional regulator [Compostimonas suwonensis]
MARDSQETRRRLLDAATREFAERGIAGARVDRIADSAGVNKSLIYTYFGNKDGLFDAVFSAMIDNTVSEAPFDAMDVPGYAGRLFDQYLERPEVLRLAVWDRLERDGVGGELGREVTARKLASIEAAQAAGALTSKLEPEELLGVVTSIVGMTTLATPRVRELDDEQRAVLRAKIVKAVTVALD